MIKSIIVALDNSQSSASAKQLSLQLAKEHRASVTGIGVLDEAWLAFPEAIPLGGAAFKAELDGKILNDAKRGVHKLEKAFAEECQKLKIPFSVIDTSGTPSSEIEHFTTEHDLLVIGKDADFHSIPSNETTDSVKQIIKDNPRPVIGTGSTIPNMGSSKVLVAFDGTFASSRAFHMALLLGIFNGKTVHIASVSSDEKEAKRNVNTAAEFCKKHDVQAQIHPLITTKKPAAALLELSEDLNPSLIVIGAYGHKGLTYFFSGSCAKDLLKSTNIPLFVYH